MEYAESGAMTSQLAEMKYHDWFNNTDKTPYQTTTEWTYDGLGRIETLTYPDGEVLTYDYDSGGLAQSIDGVEEGPDQGASSAPTPRATRSTRISPTPGRTSTSRTASTTSSCAPAGSSSATA